MRVLGHLGDGLDRRHRDVGLDQCGDDLLDRVGEVPRLDLLARRIVAAIRPVKASVLGTASRSPIVIRNSGDAISRPETEITTWP
jgi:hypothetical protein